jgi:predicted transport protein
MEFSSSAAPLERTLQTLFEGKLDALLGVRFPESEFATSNGGRMDTLGIDENGCPVIIEYKRDRSESVINQGLFYLEWLMDHRGDFELLVRDRYGKESADAIEWATPRLVCIAGDFTKYDTHAVKQMGRNIELVGYRRFGDDLLLLELLTAVSATPVRAGTAAPDEPGAVAQAKQYKTVSEMMADADDALVGLYKDLEAFLLGLGDDVTQKTLRLYLAFRRIKNFACVEFRTNLGALKPYLKIDPDTVELEEGFTRDVRSIGHFGTGDLEVTLRSNDDLERAKPLFVKSYEAS